MYTLYWGFKKTHLDFYTYDITKWCKVYIKLTSGFKNHMMYLDNFKQAVESPKSWNSMGYFCPKNTFLQLKHIQRIYLTLLSTTCVRIYLPIFHGTTPLYFLAQTLHTFYKIRPHQSANFENFHCWR